MRWVVAGQLERRTARRVVEASCWLVRGERVGNVVEATKRTEPQRAAVMRNRLEVCPARRERTDG